MIIIFLRIGPRRGSYSRLEIVNPANKRAYTYRGMYYEKKKFIDVAWASLRRPLGARGGREVKNLYKDEKRKPGRGGLLEEGAWRERDREACIEFARFIPPPVFRLRPDVFPPPASLFALRSLPDRERDSASSSPLRFALG